MPVIKKPGKFPSQRAEICDSEARLKAAANKFIKEHALLRASMVSATAAVADQHKAMAAYLDKAWQELASSDPR